MALFNVDAETCTACGACAAVCPLGLVVDAGKGKPPTPLKGREDRCISCGHCAAICPVGALELSALPLVDFEPLDRGLVPGPEQTRMLLASRRSIRFFKDEPVPREDLEKAVAVAAWSPSGHNVHSLSIAVTHSRQATLAAGRAIASWMRDEDEAGSETARELHLGGVARAFYGGRDLITRGAPHLIAFLGPARGITPGEDAVIAAAHVELTLHSMGLGACWCGYAAMAAAKSAKAAKTLGAGPGLRVHACLMAGRPARRYRRIPPRSQTPVSWIK